MEEDILQQDVSEDEEFEENMDELEKDVEQDQKGKKKVKQVKQQDKEQVKQQVGEKITETYEAFITHPRLGIANTLTGELIVEGFDIEKDQALVQSIKLILNKLDKIAIVSGA